MNQKRIYLVTGPGAGNKKLIKAYSRAQAVRHAVIGTYKAEVASQDELVSMLISGAKVESAEDGQEHAE